MASPNFELLMVTGSGAPILSRDTIAIAAASLLDGDELPKYPLIESELK
jgi:hypothetical protein